MKLADNMNAYRYGLMWSLDPLLDMPFVKNGIGKFISSVIFKSKPFQIRCNVFELAEEIDPPKDKYVKRRVNGVECGILHENKNRCYISYQHVVAMLARDVEDILDSAREAYDGADALVPFEIDLLQEGILPNDAAANSPASV